MYPNCDQTVWMRTCKKEIVTPLKGITEGHIPKWLEGNLLRNGPGCLEFENDSYLHLFDSLALLHKLV